MSAVLLGLNLPAGDRDRMRNLDVFVPAFSTEDEEGRIDFLMVGGGDVV